MTAQHPSRRSTQSVVVTASFVLAGVGIGLIKLITVVRTPAPFKGLVFSSDDVYYYVLTALRTAQGQGSTFDGVTATNGYQPLWYLVLTTIFRSGTDRDGAVVLTVVLLVVLWLAALVLLHRLGRTALGPVGALCGLVGFLVHARWWTGCENALVVVLLLGVVLLVLRRRMLSTPPPLLVVLGLGGLLALLALARLDTLLLVGLLALAGLVRGQEPVRDRVRRVALLVAPTVVVVGGYLVVNQLLFGVAVPVSGLAKQLGPAGRNWSVFRDFLLFGQIGPLPLLFGLTVLAAGVVALVLLAPARRPSLPDPTSEYAADLRLVIGLLLTAQLLQLLYYAVASTWELQGWYFSFGVVSLFLSLAVIGSRLAVHRPWPACVVAVAVVVLAVTAVHEVGVVSPRSPQASPATRDIDAGRWVDANLPPDAVLAMGDWAGTFAYSTQRPVVQLEGLVSSPEYLQALRDGAAPAFLDAHGVGYLARLTHPGEVVGCSVSEPYFGGGPRTLFAVCRGRLVYDGAVGPPEAGLHLLIWDLRRPR